MSKPDTELFYLLKRFQAGEAQAGWLFATNVKIKLIIMGRMNQYRKMFHWLPIEDIEDIECSLIPRIVEIAGNFNLPEQPNDGRIISYFNLRIRGEADFLLKKISGLKQMIDEKTGKTFLRSLSQSIDDLGDTIFVDNDVVEDVLEKVEAQRQDLVLTTIFDRIPEDSNDRIWLRCFLLKMQGRSWGEVCKDIGHAQSEYIWVKDNTARFVTRLKHGLFMNGENVDYRICGIYTDTNEVAIYVYDSHDKKKCLIWSRQYESFNDLEKIEAKLTDIFRQCHVSYVMMNDDGSDNPAFIIIMRFLTRREAFVESLDTRPFMNIMHRMPTSINGVTSNYFHKNAILLGYIKRAHLDVTRDTGILERNRSIAIKDQ